ncbi:putative lipid II flippase FtsW [Williamsia sterculiae]|uniref:Probable peptidoglycan glycosyltransferase FtsW n=1 Tax=Williamsia sterculiae TaxID=1344003 RepID=A0A1N7H6W9_9NOCA|nr:putative lipid II flippase FtsW [Williamsia sterculiae]SIS20572.1 cell division-specific peptidoglycan biosynthesis regulator FtsW [Williamsia sterculiae]
MTTASDTDATPDTTPTRGATAVRSRRQVRSSESALQTGVRVARTVSPRAVASAVLSRPLASFHLIVTLSFLLTLFGLVMVLSASSVEGYSKSGSAYGLFTTQVVFAILGTVLFYVTLRMPIRFFRRAAAPAMIATTLMLALVLIPGIGTLAQGARRWFTVGGLSVQPSELVKVALCVWGAHLLASRRRENASMRELLVPLLPVAVVICALIILEPNLSTTITIAIIVGALLWFAGLPIRVFVAFVVSGIVLAAVLAMAEGYRSQRVMSFLGQSNDPQGAGYQARQARYALANGQIWGVGLGQSRAKWNYLPNAHNDFIFAIIGEELGLIGGLLVVALFAVLAFVGLRIAMRSVDPFLRLMTATITVLVTAQAVINIGYVIGLLPVTGIQLPLLSAGGTSTFTILVMMGLLANAARHEPDAVAALANDGEGRLGRILRLPQPVAYAPSRVDQLRERLSGRRSRDARPRPAAGRQAARRPKSAAKAAPQRVQTRQRPARSTAPLHGRVAPGGPYPPPPRYTPPAPGARRAGPQRYHEPPMSTGGGRRR